MIKLDEPKDWDTGRALERLDGHIRAYCARREREKRERREAMTFALALILAVALAAVGLMVGITPQVLWIAAAAMGLTLMLSPVLAYFVEEARYEWEEE